jgi:serine/threonine protein kinase
MWKQLTCEHGHQWELTTADDVLAVVAGTVCPACGAAAMTVESPDAARPAVAAQSGAPAVPGYEVLGELGRGGMGVVYKAWHVKLKRLVALKMILSDGPARVQDLTRLRREAEAAASLQHPNIVQIFDVGEARAGAGGPCSYLALEYVAGGTLAQRLAGVPQPAEEAAALVEMLARAIHHAHERGIVHRDLKPANILLQEDLTQRRQGAKEDKGEEHGEEGRVELPPTPPSLSTLCAFAPLREVLPKIGDFGLAKQFQDGTGQTHSGAVVGTPSYMAPEQAGGPGERVGPWTDVYGLGAILYELLTGRPPFRGTSVLETLDQVRQQDPVPPSRLQPKIPRDLETICLKCLHKEPSRRFGSALDLADDLQRFRKGEPVRARPAGLPERLGRWCRRNPVPAGLAAALLVTALASFGVIIALWRHAEHQRGLAVQNLQDATRAVHDHFVLLSKTRLPRAPGTRALQKQLWEEALAYFTRFAEQARDDPARQADVAEASFRAGALHRHLGNAERALAYLEQAGAIYSRLVQSDPGDVSNRRLLGSCYHLSGAVQTSLGRFAAALESYQHARALCDELVRAQAR